MSTDGPRFFTHDHIKSVREVVDDSAVLIGRYTYDPVGRRSVASGNDATRTAFTGLAASPNVGLYLAMYRVYDPNIGTWLSEDPLGFAVAPSLHVYASGNPISRVDRLGLTPQDWREVVRGVRNVGPVDAWRGYQMSQDALADAERSGLPGLHNGPADAYRHCLRSCRMTEALGVEQAKAIADEHENAGERSGQRPDERQMDEANNDAGRNCAIQPEKKKRSCDDKCMQLLMDGGLFGLGGKPMPPPGRPKGSK
jgi:RHS repeat-associated protein